MTTDKKIIALGFFDGVHRGHGMLLNQCRKMADQMGCAAAAVTFSTHPDRVVFGRAPALINSDADREYLMRVKHGIDDILMLPFDKRMMNMSPETFFEMLRKKFDASGIVCGHDFRFGYKGEGDAAMLTELCKEAAIPCSVIPEQKYKGVTISSTYIRRLLENGEVEQAAEFLGHYHMLSGQVVTGRKLGRTLGIPTANISPAEGLVQLKHGVYACNVKIAGKQYMAVTNVGNRPTVNGHHVTVEPWILDFNGNIYGEKLMMSFHRFLRPEKKFDNLDQLKQAIQKDAQLTRNYFASLNPDNGKILDII